jgi:hypothetical protein
MRRVTRYIRTIADCFVLQANHHDRIGRASRDTYRRSRVELLAQILRDEGFDQVEIIRFPGYSRPMAIGTFSTAARQATESPAALRHAHVPLRRAG